MFSKEITLTSATGGICAWGEGARRWQLVIYPDNFTYLSIIGRISVQGEGAWWRLAMYPDHFTHNICAGGGAWRRRLQTRTHAQAHQWAANYFLVRIIMRSKNISKEYFGYFL